MRDYSTYSQKEKDIHWFVNRLIDHIPNNPIYNEFKTIYSNGSYIDTNNPSSYFKYYFAKNKSFNNYKDYLILLCSKEIYKELMEDELKERGNEFDPSSYYIQDVTTDSNKLRYNVYKVYRLMKKAG